MGLSRAVSVTCGGCGDRFELSKRNAYGWRQRGLELAVRLVIAGATLDPPEEPTLDTRRGARNGDAEPAPTHRLRIRRPVPLKADVKRRCGADDVVRNSALVPLETFVTEV
jgi:hypothetical protein